VHGAPLEVETLVGRKERARQHNPSENRLTASGGHMRAKGKTAPEKYNVAPDITRGGAKNTPVMLII